MSLRDIAVVELKLASQISYRFPLSGFLRQHEPIERLETAGAAQQHGLAFLIDGDFVEHWCGHVFFIGKTWWEVSQAHSAEMAGRVPN